ncbi:cysteine hydrolase family protein [Salibacterium aidingense]|uniref:cysteine hydrolase family protein n=1 Tax=Salibacterium aidingense TaxID=384933 RepID=UPI003BE616BF
MMKALIIIDYTNDFVADNGPLTCGEPGQKLENKIVQWIEEERENGSEIIFAVDYHKPDHTTHPEHDLFPSHNIEGTPGRKLYGKVNDVFTGIRSETNVTWMDKTRYSAFAGTPLDIFLREKGIGEIVLTGVCTDICVLHTAVDAYNKGYHLTIPRQAVASFDAGGHEWALSHFKNILGANIVGR